MYRRRRGYYPGRRHQCGCYVQRLLFITARLEHENELNIHEHAVFVNKEPGQLHYGELNTNKHEQKFAKNVRSPVHEIANIPPLTNGPRVTLAQI